MYTSMVSLLPNVCSQETAHRPILGPEDVEAVDESQEREDHDGRVRSLLLNSQYKIQRHTKHAMTYPGLEPLVVIRQHLVRDTLRSASFLEPQHHNGTADPANKAGSIRQVHKPTENNRPTARNI